LLTKYAAKGKMAILKLFGPFLLLVEIMMFAGTTVLFGIETIEVKSPHSDRVLFKSSEKEMLKLIVFGFCLTML